MFRLPFKLSMPISIRFTDSSVKSFPDGASVLHIAQSLGEKTASKAVGAFINNQNEIFDLRTSLKNGDQIEIVEIPSDAALEVIRHSAAHVMAQAVQELWPKTGVTIGPVIEDGFYYDFDRAKPFTDEDLPLIEKKMKEILNKKLELIKEVWPKDKAIKIFKEMGESYKVEIIQEIPEDEVSIYKQGDWLDLCRGPHVQHLGQIGAVKVLSHAGAYWRGDELNPQLQRLYGTAFHSKKDLDDHLARLETAKKRDHRKIGKEMDLFTFSPYAPGQPFFKKNGAVIYRELKNFLRQKYQEHSYEEVISPQVYSKDLFLKSGHLNFYQKNIYEVGKSEDVLKPMNCPGHCLLYKSRRFSYRDLPWRIADFGRLNRFERSGTLHGLMRVRGFCQDDAHIFCKMDQLKGEIQNFIRLLKAVYEGLGLNQYTIDLCMRPEKKMGDDSLWDKAEGALAGALKDMNISYNESPGEGAFYGPKLDIIVLDSLKRKWQLGTLQCDFNLPEVFELRYRDQDNQMKKPVLLHRAILGSLERFIGFYLEHSAGRLPLWLAPVQVLVMNVSKDQKKFAENVFQKLKPNLRSILDTADESLGYKIRQARTLRAAYVLIIGKKEEESQKLSVRLPGSKTVEVSMEVFLSKTKEEIKERKVHHSSF